VYIYVFSHYWFIRSFLTCYITRMVLIYDFLQLRFKSIGDGQNIFIRRLRIRSGSEIDVRDNNNCYPRTEKKYSPRFRLYSHRLFTRLRHVLTRRREITRLQTRAINSGPLALHPRLPVPRQQLVQPMDRVAADQRNRGHEKPGSECNFPCLSVIVAILPDQRCSGLACTAVRWGREQPAERSVPPIRL